MPSKPITSSTNSSFEIIDFYQCDATRRLNYFKILTTWKVKFYYTVTKNRFQTNYNKAVKLNKKSRQNCHKMAYLR